MKSSNLLSTLIAAGTLLGVFVWISKMPVHATPRPAVRPAPPTESGDDKPEYMEALRYFTTERAYPGTAIDWSMYQSVALQNLQNPGLPPAGNVWKYLGPNNLASPSGNKFQYQGPSPLAGRVDCVAFGAGTTIYAGSATGGFYQGTYGSGVWKELSSSAWPTLACSCCAVDPTGKNIYVGTGDFEGMRPDPPGPMGLMESFDSGATWTNVPPPQFGSGHVSRIALDPDTFAGNNGTVIATTGRSSGGGIDPVEDYLGTGNLWISTDKGKTWNVANGTTVNGAVWSACAVSPRSLTTGLRYYYAVCFVPAGVNKGGQVWRSDDQGATWHQTAMNPFVAANQFSLDLACSPTNSDNVYVVSGGGTEVIKGANVAYGDSTISQSANGGNTWTNITGAGATAYPGDNGVGGAGYNWTQSDYDYTIGVSSRVVAGKTVDVVFVGMIDIGSAVQDGVNNNVWTWQGKSYDVAANNHLTHNDDHCLAFNPTNPNQALFGNDGGIYGMTLNAGGIAAFAPFNNSLWVSEFYNMAFLPAGANSYYTGGCQDIAVPFLGKGMAGPASNWTNVNSYPGDGGYCAIDPATPANQFFAGYYLNDGATRIYSTVNTWGAATYIGQNPMAPVDRGAFIPPMVRNPADGSLLLGMNHLWQYKAGAWAIYKGTDLRNTTIDDGKDYVRAIAVSKGGGYFYTGSLEGSVWVNPPNGVWAEIDQGGTNAGTVSLPQTAPNNRTVTGVAIDPQNSARIWVTLSGPPGGMGRVWRCDFVTDNAKRTWTPLPIKVGGNTVDIPACCIAINPNNSKHLEVGTDMGVYTSFDGGATWVNYTSPFGLPVVSVRAIDFQKIGATNFISIATFGRGAWQFTYSAVAPPPGPAP